jgi:chromosome segregation ATPase
MGCYNIRTLVEQSAAHAALAAKDAEIARLKSDRARPESLDVGLMRAEIAAMTTDRDEWKESTIDANKRFKTAEQDVYTMTAERDALKAESIKTESTTARLRMDYGSMAQRLTEMVRMCGGYQDQVVALTAERDALRKPETARMTAADIEEMMNNMAIYDGDYETAIVRATEKHHGIGL